MNHRVERLLEELDRLGLEGLVVSNQNNIYYLTGFWGTESTVFVSRNRLVFVTDSRYTRHAKNTVVDFEIHESRSYLETIYDVVKEEKLSRIGFEDSVSVAYHQGLKTLFEGVELEPTHQVIETIRQIKDASEIETIRSACKISDQAFLDALDFIKAGKTELEVANFLDFRMRELGASGISFETIVASGIRSSMPHGVASDKVIENGEAITLDFGCYYNHYVSDMTRTIYLGHASDEEQEIYQTVLAANEKLIQHTKAGLGFREFDKIPRDVITEAGYGNYFTHGIGHGIGLDIHEEPYFSQLSKEVIQTNMVLTDEPGIYLDGQYGVRIEDDLWITETGCEILTLAPKELIIL